jgi:hypothetical protein
VKYRLLLSVHLHALELKFGGLQTSIFINKYSWVASRLEEGLVLLFMSTCQKVFSSIYSDIGILKVLTMVCTTQIHWVCGLYPSSGMHLLFWVPWKVLLVC